MAVTSLSTNCAFELISISLRPCWKAHSQARPVSGSRKINQTMIAFLNASLDDIAKDADVGAGALYRHFPTRDALIEAVYGTEVEKLAAERKFTEAMPPIEALRARMLLFVD